MGNFIDSLEGCVICLLETGNLPLDIERAELTGRFSFSNSFFCIISLVNDVNV